MGRILDGTAGSESDDESGSESESELEVNRLGALISGRTTRIISDGDNPTPVFPNSSSSDDEDENELSPRRKRKIVVPNGGRMVHTEVHSPTLLHSPSSSLESGELSRSTDDGDDSGSHSGNGKGTGRNRQFIVVGGGPRHVISHDDPASPPFHGSYSDGERSTESDLGSSSDSDDDDSDSENEPKSTPPPRSRERLVVEAGGHKKPPAGDVHGGDKPGLEPKPIEYDVWPQPKPIDIKTDRLWEAKKLPPLLGWHSPADRLPGTPPRSELSFPLVVSWLIPCESEGWVEELTNDPVPPAKPDLKLLPAPPAGPSIDPGRRPGPSVVTAPPVTQPPKGKPMNLPRRPKRRKGKSINPAPKPRPQPPRRPGRMVVPGNTKPKKRNGKRPIAPANPPKLPSSSATEHALPKPNTTITHLTTRHEKYPEVATLHSPTLDKIRGLVNGEPQKAIGWHGPTDRLPTEPQAPRFRFPMTIDLRPEVRRRLPVLRPIPYAATAAETKPEDVRQSAGEFTFGTDRKDPETAVLHEAPKGRRMGPAAAVPPAKPKPPAKPAPIGNITHGPRPRKGKGINPGRPTPHKPARGVITPGGVVPKKPNDKKPIAPGLQSHRATEGRVVPPSSAMTRVTTRHEVYPNVATLHSPTLDKIRGLVNGEPPKAIGWHGPTDRLPTEPRPPGFRFPMTIHLRPEDRRLLPVLRPIPHSATAAETEPEAVRQSAGEFTFGTDRKDPETAVLHETPKGRRMGPAAAVPPAKPRPPAKPAPIGKTSHRPKPRKGKGIHPGKPTPNKPGRGVITPDGVVPKKPNNKKPIAPGLQSHRATEGRVVPPSSAMTRVTTRHEVYPNVATLHSPTLDKIRGLVNGEPPKAIGWHGRTDRLPTEPQAPRFRFPMTIDLRPEDRRLLPVLRPIPHSATAAETKPEAERQSAGEFSFGTDRKDPETAVLHEAPKGRRMGPAAVVPPAKPKPPAKPSPIGNITHGPRPRKGIAPGLQSHSATEGKVAPPGSAITHLTTRHEKYPDVATLHSPTLDKIRELVNGEPPKAIGWHAPANRARKAETKPEAVRQRARVIPILRGQAPKEVARLHKARPSPKGQNKKPQPSSATVQEAPKPNRPYQADANATTRGVNGQVQSIHVNGPTPPDGDDDPHPIGGPDDKPVPRKRGSRLLDRFVSIINPKSKPGDGCKLKLWRLAKWVIAIAVGILVGLLTHSIVAVGIAFTVTLIGCYVLEAVVNDARRKRAQEMLDHRVMV